MLSNPSRTHTNHILQKTFVFKNFEDAMRRMQACSLEISMINHHPTRTNTYNKVDVTLTTHDADNMVTELDHKLAQLMDQQYESSYSNIKSN